MMTFRMLFGGAMALAMTLSVPALAQMAGDHAKMGEKPAGHMTKPNEADMKKMATCNAMSHGDAMKDAGCAALMKAHPEMMNHKPAPAPSM